jgi:GntR family transcriptional regulator/MocR family aminotransferase
MARFATTIPMTGIDLDRSSPVPLSRQLYDRLRATILSGQLGSGFRLPATRTLAAELGISRNTVLLAYDQLLAEGYIEGKAGSGTTVARALPETLLHAPHPGAEAAGRFSAEVDSGRPSRRGAALAAMPTVRIAPETLNDWLKPFRTGIPALDHVPAELWARLITRHLRGSRPDLLGYQEVAGYGPLCTAIAAYLGASRGVRCTADQVIVVGGAQGGLDLAARVLLDPGDTAWIEDPGYFGARGALLAAGARLVPVPVDAAGLDVAAGEARAPDARAVYVTPSHQYPLGATMSLPRRLALLDWAARAGAWVVEDDYDGEFRYAGRPLAALHSLRPDARVIYVGTFSKVLFPALRLGYLVVPPDLVRHFVAARCVVDFHAPVLEQMALADFIAEGHFARHLRRMRTLYAARAQALVAAASAELSGLLDVRPPTTGMHVVGWLPPGIDDRVAARRAAAHDVSAVPISAFAVEPQPRGGLLLGFAAVDEPAIRDGVRRLAAALRPLVRGLG